MAVAYAVDTHDPFADFRVPLAQDRDGDGSVSEDEQGRR